MAAKTLFKVVFINQGKIYEIFARKVHQEMLYGFICVEDLVFGTRSDLVLDPSEERLKDEFNEVRRSLIPMHAVIRIDEVTREATPRIVPAEGNVTAFPGPVYTPGGDAKK
ncbi:MAG: DUF1820 family protein [Pseudomonadota bacterium]|nr:DUF1820 family protein [Pseudomonadota bacterium]